MTRARRRGRPAPLRWGGSLAIAGLCVSAAGGYLAFGDRAGAVSPAAAPGTATRAPSLVAPAPPGSTPGAIKVPPGVTEKPGVSRSPGTSPRTGTRKPAARAARPQRISVPRLAVSAPVVAISVRGGLLTPPSNPRTVGWWSGGARPGAERGSAVITGHAVRTGGGAFDELARLRRGDAAVVATSRGSLRYRVTAVTTYRKQALATHAARVFDQDVPGRLVLITCKDWNGRTYLSNVVVIAERTA